MPHVDGLFHSNVSPMGDFNDAGDAANGEEGGVVLIMDLQGILKRTKKEITPFASIPNMNPLSQCLLFSWPKSA